MPTIPNIINYAKVTQYLYAIKVSKGGLFGSGGVDTQFVNKIYCIRKNLEWLYALNPADATLTATSNYLYSLCNPIAASLTIGGGGGTVSPILPTTLPVPLDFIVDATSSFILAGATSATLTQFIGFEIQFVRAGSVMSKNNVGGSYFSWNKLTGAFSFTGPATVGEIFQINPMI